MPQQDEIQLHFSQAEQDDAFDIIAQLEALLQPKLQNLSPEENVEYGVISEQNKLFVNKVKDYRTTNPALSSGDVDWPEFEADFADRFFLETAAMRIEGLTQSMTETKRIHDHDNYKNALLDYDYTKYKNKTQPGKGYDKKEVELGQFFQGGSQKSTITPPEQ